jgi:hypothetical protein
MFGGHRRQGREAGLATRNTFSAVSVGTSLFDFGKGFQPTREFLRHPYVLAFSTTTIGFMMKMVFKGESWTPLKKMEFFNEAIQEFSMNHLSHKEWLDLMETASGVPSFAKGKNHAEGVFFASHKLIGANSLDPLVIKAREASRNLPPPSDLAAGMLWCTVREFLHETFPMRDPNAAPF